MMSVSNQGDDCYFYYYSTCTKGDSCPFRHCEAAMGSETVCSLWQENRCFRKICKFRHMEIKKNRKEIPCYWENQPGGCQKPHCAFHHEKPRVIDGLYVPPNKGTAVRNEKEEETPKEDQVPAPVSNAANPQLRGVIKTETQENVPSPTHPPVVINPVDDEDDDDDQFSEEGDEASSVSPRKLLSSGKDDSLNFGIRTLEEIRLAKALKASLKGTGHSVMQCSNGTRTEIRSFRQPAVVFNKNAPPAFEDPGKKKVSDRLGKRFDDDILVEGGLKLRGTLAMRLGGFVDSPENKTDMPNQKGLRPVRERLGIIPDLAAPKSPNSEPKPSGEIRIKSLEEIRQEKAANTQMRLKGAGSVTEVPENTASTTKRGSKPVSGSHVKTFSEILHEKKKFKEEKVVSQEGSSSAESIEGPPNARAVNVTAQEGEVRVKTLEEIRKEKAARMQAQSQNTTNDKATVCDVTQKRRILRVPKNTSAANSSSQKNLQDSEKKADSVKESAVANGKSGSSSPAVTVKSFEEIMREKRLRKQQEDQAAADKPEQAAQQPNPAPLEEKTLTVRPEIPSLESTALDAESKNREKSSIQQRLSLKSRTPSPVTSGTSQRKSELAEAKDIATSPKKIKLTSSVALPEVEPQPESIQTVTKTSPSKAAEIKVRPKLNVKPSVMKPAIQVSPGQKRKATGSQCSAVAAVKPLTAAPSPEGEPQRKRIATCSTEAGVSTQQVSSPAEQSTNLPIRNRTSANKPQSVPQSPIGKTPSLSRARRASMASARGHAPAGSSSTKDDFEDLLDEFTDDRLDDEIELDSGKGEDDLLLELSKMIGS